MFYLYNLKYILKLPVVGTRQYQRLPPSSFNQNYRNFQNQQFSSQATCNCFHRAIYKYCLA